MKKYIFVYVIFFGLFFLAIHLIVAGAPLYTITFMSNDNVFYTTTTKGNEDIVWPSDPLTANYTFDGWYFDEDTWNKQVTSDYFVSHKINEDVFVYAKFIQSCKIANFYVESDAYFNFNFLIQSDFEMPTNPSIDEYIFDGWYFDNNIWQQPATKDNILTNVQNEIVDIYAKFIPPSQYINAIFYIDDETIYASNYYIQGREIIMPNDPEIESFIFHGWYLDKGTWEQEVTQATLDEIQSGKISIYAKMEMEFSSDLVYVLSEDETYYIVQGVGENTCPKIFIPNSYNGLPVKEIGQNAFYRNDTIIELLISNNIETVGRCAIAWCQQLERIRFVKNSKLNSIADLSFYCNKRLNYLDVPKGITVVPKYAFAQTSDTIEIVFENPASITRLEDYALYGTGVLSWKFVNLEYIGEHCFANSAKLASFFLPKTLTTINYSAFNDCRSLTYVEMEDLVSWLSVDIYGGRFSMPWCYGGKVYMNNEMVKEINIPEGIKIIKDFAFFDCRFLQVVTIPESVEIIGTAAFADVLRLKIINYNAVNCSVSLERKESNDINLPFENAGKYTLSPMAPGWKPPEGYRDIVVNIGKNVTKIPAKLFYSASGYYPPLIGTINFSSSESPIIETNWLTKTSILKKITVPQGSLESYQANLYTSLHSYLQEVSE